jgi:hypothetical protein
MDDRTFDHLAKTLSATPSRRGLLAGLLAAAGFGAGDVAAKRRSKSRGKGKGQGGGKEHGRNRGNGRHRPGKGKGKGKGGGTGTGCDPAPQASACAGRCGPVDLGCGKRADCGPCNACAADADCAPCGRCEDGTCAADPGTAGAACDPGGDGEGVCDADACAPCGGAGEPCCPGDACRGGSCCEAGSCLEEGAACGGPATCSGGTFTPRGTCAAGSCAAGQPEACAPYGCAGDRCAETCAGDADCAGDHFCNAQDRCAGDKALGEGCDRPEQCASGFCAQGVCCDGACAACGTGGVCAPRADGAACAAAGGGDGVCTGAVCEPCGAAGEPCCPGNTPCADFGCCDPDTGRCVAGGGVWGVDFEPECAGKHAVCDCRPNLTYYDPADPSGPDHTPRLTCTQPGACRANHAPVATPVDVRHPWRYPCVPVVLAAFDADHDHLFFRVTSLPQNGFLTNRVDPYVSARAAAAGDSPRDPHNYPLWGQLNQDAGGWTTGEPAPLDGLRRDCTPHCWLDGLGTCPDSGDYCPGCGADGDYRDCPEGWYQQMALCYIPFKSTFSGFDTFEYVVWDIHGVESAPATVFIEVFER